MRIEKINENQIRCILSKEDLANRQMKLSELAYGSEKAKQLFRDMIECANDKFGFEADDIPVMIEAIPLSGESIILQITKVEYPEELDTRFSKFSDGGDAENEFLEDEPSFFADMQGADDVLDILEKMKKDLEKQVEEKEKNPDGTDVSKSEIKKVSLRQKQLQKNLTGVYEFENLNRIERLAGVLGDYYMGENDLYKDEKTNRYYLFLRKSNHAPEEFNKVCNIISEYGTYKKYKPVNEAFFKEHGKLIIKGNALQMFSKLH